MSSVGGNAENKLVWVGFKPDATVSDERLIKAVKAAGFNATVLDNVMVRSASSSGGANDGPACGVTIQAQPVTPTRLKPTLKNRGSIPPEKAPLGNAAFF